MMRKYVFLAAVAAVLGGLMFIPASRAHQSYSPETLKGTWTFSERYSGAYEAAFVGTIRFDGHGGCDMKWMGIRTDRKTKPGASTCTYEVAPDGSGIVVPEEADMLHIQIAQHGKRIEYIIEPELVGLIGSGTMTRL